MENSAQSQRKNILITDVGSYLGRSLAQYFISRNHHVFGLSSHHIGSELLSHKSFTLLDLDLKQPLPSHLPQLSLICYLMLKSPPQKEFLTGYAFSHDLSNVLSYAQTSGSQLFVFTPVTQDPDVYKSLAIGFENKDKVSLFLVGDTYGPQMDFHQNNELADIISQSISSDKIVLGSEGKNHIYPAYIYDVVAYTGKCLIQKHNPVEFLVTSEPQTTLEIAYEIQKVIYKSAQKDLGIFFSGPPNGEDTGNPIKVQILENGISLETGLKNTLNFYSEQHQKTQAEVKTKLAWIPPRPIQQQITGKPPQVRQEHFEPQTKKIKKSRIKIKKPNLKLTFAAFAVLLILFLGKITLDTFSGINYLNMAKNRILSSDLKKAGADAHKAAKSLASAVSAIESLTLPISYILPTQIKQINNLLSASQKTALSIEALTLASEALNKDLLIVSTDSSASKPLDQETPVIYFQKAYRESVQVQELLKNAQNFILFSNQAQALREANTKSSQIAKQGEAITQLLTAFTGTNQPATYLLLVQNNAELRPGGGFIGNIGLLEFEKGRLKGISVDDVYNLDGQLKEKIEPPKELAEKLGVDNFYLRDSNWSPDFQLNSKTARDFYKKVTGKSVNGVIAFDLNLMQNLLKIIGPIKLDDYNEEISADNLFERGEFYSEIGFFPGSTQKKDFFGSLSRKLIETLIATLTNPSSSAKGLSILEAVHESILEKHVMLSFDNSDLSTYLLLTGLDRTLPPSKFNPIDDEHETRDFMSISEANIGANKVNRYIERKVDYEMTIGRDADLMGMLTISYTNNSQAETWPGGKYANFLRIYLPAGTSLEDYSQDPPAPQPSPAPKGTKAKTPSTVDESAPPQVTTQGSLTVFSKYIEVPIKSTKTITFTYRIHKNIKLETAPTYHLYVQKQPGTEKDPFTFRFNLPNYLAVKSVNGAQAEKQPQNIQVTSDLATDRQFEIEVVKK